MPKAVSTSVTELYSTANPLNHRDINIHIPDICFIFSQLHTL